VCPWPICFGGRALLQRQDARTVWSSTDHVYGPEAKNSTRYTLWYGTCACGGVLGIRHSSSLLLLHGTRPIESRSQIVWEESCLGRKTARYLSLVEAEGGGFRPNALIRYVVAGSELVISLKNWTVDGSSASSSAKWWKKSWSLTISCLQRLRMNFAAAVGLQPPL
jgi:hypothetical protein